MSICLRANFVRFTAFTTCTTTGMPANWPCTSVAGEELLAALDLALLELDRLGAQHQVREVQVPGVRRRVRTLGHVAQVAQVALVDHLPVVVLLDAVHLAVVGGIDQVEQVREALAQAHAAAAAVADVEHPLHLLEGRGLVVEVGAFPVDRVPGRGFEVAFAHGVVPLRCAGSGNAVRRTNKGHEAPCSALTLHRAVSRPARRAPSGSGWHASARPWPASRTSRRSRRGLLSRAVLAMPGYMSVYSCVSPATAAARFCRLDPIGSPVAGSPTGLEELEVAMRVAGLAFGGGTEQRGHVVLALDVGLVREVQIAAVGLRFARKGVLQVLFGLRSFQAHLTLLVGERTIHRRATEATNANKSICLPANTKLQCRP